VRKNTDKTKVPHTLLLADDSVTIQRVIELTFADEDVRVVAVGDGDQAIAVLDEAPPDIVLADIGMPGRDGYQVAQHIRDTPGLAHIPVVLLTGAFEPIDQAKAAAVGCDGVLAKPFEPQQVIGRVRELLARPKTPPPVRGDEDAAPSPPWPTPMPLSDRSLGSHGAAAPEPFGAESYFDRLDQALATATAAAAPAPKAADRITVGEEIDWFSSLPPTITAPDAPPVKAERAVPEPPVTRSEAAPVAISDHKPPPSPAVQPAAPAIASFPPLADAFAALLTAEQSAPTPADAPLWPSAAPTGIEITDDLVDRVARRVLDQLSDRVVRETVSELTSAVAERLVREEIERIKGSIR
jgi:CheY-like chemotaxis protein